MSNGREASNGVWEMGTHIVRAIGPLGIAAMGLLLVAPFARADMLAPGQTTAAPPQADPIGGVVIAGGVPVSFSSATFSGTLTSSVIQGDASNPYGGLTFTYLLTNDPASPDQIERLTINGFGLFPTDVNWQIGPGLTPKSVDRSLGGSVVGFSFLGLPFGAGTLLPGQFSALLVVQTNSVLYVPSYASVIDGSVSSVSSFAPLPEPATLSALALGGLALLGRRRSQG
jgi:hypothetical protein